MISIDIVKIDEMFRLCYGGTEELVMLDDTQPLDRFETVMDNEAAQMHRRIWVLRHREAIKPYGYVNKGQAHRALDMICEAKVEIVEWQPQKE